MTARALATLLVPALLLAAAVIVSLAVEVHDLRRTLTGAECDRDRYRAAADHWHQAARNGVAEGQWQRGPGMDVFPPRLGGGEA